MNELICTNCGTSVSVGEAWCKRCGARLPYTARSERGPATDPIEPARFGPAALPAIPAYGLPASQRIFGGQAGPDGGVWRDGDTLVMHKSARMPDYCIKCGAPANGTHLHKKLSWHHPALALLILVGLLIYLIVALLVRKSARVDISLCEEHLRKHRISVLVTWLTFALGVAFIAIAIAADSGGSALFGFLLVFASLISALTWAKIVQVKKIDDQYVWLRRIDENFLSLLPDISRR